VANVTWEAGTAFKSLIQMDHTCHTRAHVSIEACVPSKETCTTPKETPKETCTTLRELRYVKTKRLSYTVH